MTADDVIRLGKEADVTFDVNLFDLSSGEYIMIGVCVVVYVFLASLHIKMGAETKVFLMGMGFVLFLAVTIILTGSMDIKHDRIASWETNVALPYIEQLPVEEYEIIYIKIDPELSHNTSGVHVAGFGTTSSDVSELTPLTLSFKKDGHVNTMTEWVYTEMTLSTKAKPYIRYQELNQDLGHNIQKGKYNMNVYLPEDYSFSTIE